MLPFRGIGEYLDKVLCSLRDYIHAIYLSIWKYFQKGFIKYPFMEI